jgi:hypothetical protein
MVLALEQRLSDQGYYWYNIPKSAGFPFLALVEHTNFLSPEHFGGDHIIYIGDYLEPDHEFFRLSQDEILARFLPSLPRFNPRFQPDWIRKTWLFRTPYAQPVPLVNHSQNIPAIDSQRTSFCQHEPGGSSIIQFCPLNRQEGARLMSGQAPPGRILHVESPIPGCWWTTINQYSGIWIEGGALLVEQPDLHRKPHPGYCCARRTCQRLSAKQVDIDLPEFASGAAGSQGASPAPTYFKR